MNLLELAVLVLILGLAWYLLPAAIALVVTILIIAGVYYGRIRG